MLTIVTGHAFLEKIMMKRLEKSPALQIFGKLRTREQQRTDIRLEILKKFFNLRILAPNPETL